MVLENGTDWRPEEPESRGRHADFRSALEAVRKSLAAAGGEGFFDTLKDRWPDLFPGCAARPGRHDGDLLVLYVRSAPALFSMRPKLPAMKRALAALPDAPKKLRLLLEIKT